MYFIFSSVFHHRVKPFACEDTKAYVPCYLDMIFFKKQYYQECADYIASQNQACTDRILEARRYLPGDEIFNNFYSEMKQSPFIREEEAVWVQQLQILPNSSFSTQ